MTTLNQPPRTSVQDRLAEMVSEAGDLLARQRDRQPVRNESPAVTVNGADATIRLYDVIDEWGDWWGTSASEFVAELDALPATVETVTVLINSPGGSVFEAIAMMNALRRHPARVVAVVEGLAASAASYIAASADETVMMPTSQMMIHAAWGGCRGDSADMREMADLLDHLTLAICEVYEAKSGRPADEWFDDLAGVDVWMSAQEAVAAGLADRVEDLTPAPADPSASTSAHQIADDPVVDETASADAETESSGFELDVAARLALLI